MGYLDEYIKWKLGDSKYTYVVSPFEPALYCTKVIAELCKLEKQLMEQMK